MQIDPQSTGATSALKKALDASRLVADKLVSSSTLESSGGARPTVVSPVEVVPSAEQPAFTVDISEEARALEKTESSALVGGEASTAQAGEDGTRVVSEDAAADASAASSESEVRGANELSAEELAQVRELQQRDAEVRTHENAHASAGGALAGAPSYEYQQGPDGRQYAVGGEVPIRIQEGATPEETLRIANQIRAAALAPSEPSSADLSVAASATSLELKARAELSEERLAELTEGSPATAENAMDSPEDDEATVDSAAPATGAIDPRVRDYGHVAHPTGGAAHAFSFFG